MCTIGMATGITATTIGSYLPANEMARENTLRAICVVEQA
jgi:hypothetical protein